MTQNELLTQDRIDVLDHGFVELVDSMGSDLTVVNAARVSFGNRKYELDDKDVKLINYLAKHKHWSPFRHVQFQFHIKAPEIVLRQHYKHVVGIRTTEGTGYVENDHAWNELSLRYVRADELDFYIPEKFRLQSADNKQGSTEEYLRGEEHDDAVSNFYDAIEMSKNVYNILFKMGVAKEIARCVIPLNVYTECYWTCSLQAAVNYIVLRKDPHAQWEIQQYAEAFEQFVKQVCPVAYEALMNNGIL